MLEIVGQSLINPLVKSQTHPCSAFWNVNPGANSKTRMLIRESSHLADNQSD